MTRSWRSDREIGNAALEDRVGAWSGALADWAAEIVADVREELTESDQPGDELLYEVADRQVPIATFEQARLVSSSLELMATEAPTGPADTVAELVGSLVYEVAMTVASYAYEELS